jgi:hypothetical protein
VDRARRASFSKACLFSQSIAQEVTLGPPSGYLYEPERLARLVLLLNSTLTTNSAESRRKSRLYCQDYRESPGWWKLDTAKGGNMIPITVLTAIVLSVFLYLSNDRRMRREATVKRCAQNTKAIETRRALKTGTTALRIVINNQFSRDRQRY